MERRTGRAYGASHRLARPFAASHAGHDPVAGAGRPAHRHGRSRGSTTGRPLRFRRLPNRRDLSLRDLCGGGDGAGAGRFRHGHAAAAVPARLGLRDRRACRRHPALRDEPPPRAGTTRLARKRLRRAARTGGGQRAGAGPDSCRSLPALAGSRLADLSGDDGSERPTSFAGFAHDVLYTDGGRALVIIGCGVGFSSRHWPWRSAWCRFRC